MAIRSTIALLTSAQIVLSLACAASDEPQERSESLAGMEVTSTPASSAAVVDTDDLVADIAAVGVLEASMAVQFDSIEELADSADTAVIGTVQSSMSTSFQGVPFTVSELLVEETVFGDAKAGQVVSVVETGGLSSGRSKVPGEEGVFADPVEVALDGVPVMKTAERWLLVLWRYEGPIEGATYIPAGEFQGKFRVNTSGVIEFTGDASHMDDSHFATAKLAENIAVEDLVSTLRSVKT